MVRNELQKEMFTRRQIPTASLTISCTNRAAGYARTLNPITFSYTKKIVLWQAIWLEQCIAHMKRTSTMSASPPFSFVPLIQEEFYLWLETNFKKIHKHCKKNFVFIFFNFNSKILILFQFFFFKIKNQSGSDLDCGIANLCVSERPDEEEEVDDRPEWEQQDTKDVIFFFHEFSTKTTFKKLKKLFESLFFQFLTTSIFWLFQFFWNSCETKFLVFLRTKISKFSILFNI